MSLVKKFQLGGATVTTPIYKPISNRTYFLEAKRSGLIPNEVLYSSFIKTPDLYAPKDSNMYRFDVATKTFHKNFPQTQTTQQDTQNLQQLGKPVTKSAVSPFQMKSILKNLNGGKLNKNIADSVIPNWKKINK